MVEKVITPEKLDGYEKEKLIEAVWRETNKISKLKKAITS
jgi:hypothetical protein